MMRYGMRETGLWMPMYLQIRSSSGGICMEVSIG